jgi:hypothetical protein
VENPFRFVLLGDELSSFAECSCAKIQVHPVSRDSRDIPACVGDEILLEWVEVFPVSPTIPSSSCVPTSLVPHCRL